MCATGEDECHSGGIGTEDAKEDDAVASGADDMLSEGARLVGEDDGRIVMRCDACDCSTMSSRSNKCFSLLARQ